MTIPTGPFLAARGPIIVVDEWWTSRRDAWAELLADVEAPHPVSNGSATVGCPTGDLDLSTSVKLLSIIPDTVTSQPPEATVEVGVGRVLLRPVSPPPPTAPAQARAAPSYGLLADLLAPASDWTAPAELPQLKGRGIERIGLDTETYDPDLKAMGPGSHRGAYVAGLSVAIDGDTAWYLPVQHEGGGNLDPEKVRRWALDELDGFDGEIVGAHTLYDLEMLGMWGLTFPRVRGFHDVLLADPILDEWQDGYSLEAVAQRTVGEGKDEMSLRAAAEAYGFGIKSDLHRLPAKFVGPYGEYDAKLPLRVLERQLAALDADDQRGIYDLERRLIPPLLAMRKRGVRIDAARAEEVHAKLAGERDRWLAALKRLAGPGAELKATASLVPELECRGFTLPRTAPSSRHPDGQPSITDAWLERHRADEVVSAIWAGRRADTIATFVKNSIIDHTVGGRIYCGFSQLKRERDGGGGSQGTIARFSSSSPNLQQVSGRKKDSDDLLDLDEAMGATVRGLFLPDEGDVWECKDFSQVEFRFLVNSATGAGAEDAVRAYNDDPKTDYHKLTATMARIDPDDIIRRRQVKNVNFSYVNGAGPKKIAELLKCDKDEADAFLALYNSRLPFVRKTYDAYNDIANLDGVVKTVLGRKQRFPFWEPKKNYNNDRRAPLPHDRALAEYGPDIQRSWTYRGISRYISGSAADLMKKSMADAWDAGVCGTLGAFLLTVHDELDLSVPPGPEAAEAVAELRRIMETCIEARVPFLTESKSGSTWGVCA